MIDGNYHLSEVLAYVTDMQTEVPYLLIGDNGDGTHAVVCINDRIWHDVALIKTQTFTAPVDSDWVLVFFGVKLNNKVSD